MLKKIYAIGLLTATALGCILTPAAHASQIEVNSQSGAQSASVVGTGNAVLQKLDQTSLQDQLHLPRYYYHPSELGEPQIQLSGQNAIQNGAAAGAGNAVIQHIDQSSIQDQLGS